MTSTIATPSLTAPAAPAAGAAPGWQGVWHAALRRWSARFAAAWLALVAAIGIFAPLLSNGHPIWFTRLDPAGAPLESSSPIWRHMTRIDVALLLAVMALPLAWIATRHRREYRAAAMLGGLLLAGALSFLHAPPPALASHQGYRAADTRATFVLNPWSPGQREAERSLAPPGTRAAHASYLLGSDAVGSDALAQLIHGCRLAISIGFVSTGLAILIGVTIGAIMGYFGGWIDAFLMRAVEIFMGVPLVFLLITAAAVLPRSTYLMMAIIGCCSWTGAARFTRAEFMKLRQLDFVQAARAAGLPTRSIIFRHMLPSGVAPVLVDASFAIAAAILAEATLSFLGLGPPDQASWGGLLADALGSRGFVWWLAIFPGTAIFLTVLSYNVLGESLRETMDPRERLRVQG